MSTFRKELESLLNTFSMENGSNTPDFLLAEFLGGCLENYDRAVKRRDAWYGVALTPGQSAEAHVGDGARGIAVTADTPTIRGGGK